MRSTIPLALAIIVGAVAVAGAYALTHRYSMEPDGVRSGAWLVDQFTGRMWFCLGELRAARCEYFGRFHP